MANKEPKKGPGMKPITNITQLSGLGAGAVTETDNKPDYKAAIRALQNSEKTDHSTWRVIGEGVFGANGEDSTSLMASMLSQGDRDKTYDMLSGLNPTDPGAAAARQAYMQHVDYERETEANAKALQEAARYAGGYAGSRTAAEDQYVGEVPQFDAARVKASAPSTVTAEADRKIRQIEQMMRQAGRTGLGSTAELEAQLAQAQKERQAALDAYAAQIREEYRQANKERSRAAGERKSEQIGLLDLQEADAQTNRDNRAALARALSQNDSHAQLEQALYAAQGANDQAEVERIQRELTRLDNPTAPVTIEDLQAERDRLQRAYNEAGMRAYAGGGRGETPAQMQEIRDAMDKIDARIEAKQTAQSTGAADRALETEIQTYHDFETLDVEALVNQIGVYDSLIEFARSRQTEALNDPAVRTGLRDKAETPWKKWVDEEARLRALRDEAQEKLDAKQRYDRSLSDNDRRMLQQIEDAKQNLDRSSAAAQAYADTLHEKQEDYQEARRAYREERAKADAYAWKSGQYYAAVKAYNYALQSGAGPEDLAALEQKAETLAFEADAAYQTMYEPYAQGEAAAALNQAAREVNAAAYKYSLTAQRVEDRVGAYYKAYDALAADRASLPKEYYTAYENVVGLTALIDGYHDKLDALYEEENALLAQGQSGSARAQEIDGLIGEYNRKITDWMLERAQYYSYAYTYDYTRTMAELPEEDRKKFEAILTGNTKDRDALLEKYGQTKYERTLEMVQRAYNEEQRKKQQAKIQNLSGLEAVNASIASVASNLLSAPGVLYEIIRQGAGNYGSIENFNAYRPYDTNAPGFAAQNFTRDVRGVIGARIEQDMLAAGSSAEQAHWGSIAYATVLSGLDSLLAMGVGSAGHAMGISAELGGHLLGVTAAANSMQDIAERGGNLGEILAGGTIAGIFEGLFENWSIENFRALTQKEIVHNVGEMLENIGKSMLTNFSEEANTEIANIAYDVVTGMLGMPSEWKDRFDELKRQEKLTDSQAFKAVAAEIGVQILEAGASGALMGFGFGMLGSVENRLKGYMQDIVEGGVRRGIALRFDRVADRNANLLPEYQVDLTYTAGTTTAADVREMAQKVYDAEVKQNAARKAAEQAHPEETERVQAKAQELAEVRVRTTATAADISAQAEAGAQAGETDAEIAREGTENARESARIAENAISRETTVNTAQAETKQAEAAGRGGDAENAYAREEARQIVDELAEQYADMDMLAYAVNDRADVFERQEGWPEMAQALRQELAERQAGSAPAETPSVTSGNAMESAQAQAGQIVNRILAETEGNDTQVREAIYAEAENQRAAGNDAVADEIINQYETMWAEQQEEDQRNGVYSDRDGRRDAGQNSAEGRTGVGESTGTAQAAKQNAAVRRQGGNSQAERIAYRVNEAQQKNAPRLPMNRISRSGDASYDVQDITDTTTDEELVALKKIAAQHGVNLRIVLGGMHFVGMEKAANGWLNGLDIVVRADSPSMTATQIYMHEYFHSLAADNPGLVTAAYDALAEAYEAAGYDMDEIDRKYQGAYEGAYRNMDPEERQLAIMEEMCADLYAGFARKVDAPVQAQEAVRQTVQERTGESYREARPEATQAQQETRDKVSLEGDDFEEDKYFARQMDKWDSLTDGARIKVGTVKPGSALNQVGLPAERMFFDVGKIRKSMGDHQDHLTSNVLKQIPDLLNDPIVIAEYTRTKNTVNVYGNLKINDKTPIVVGVVMRRDANGSTIINNIRTIHARSDFAKNINDKTVLYLNEDRKRTRKWFHDCGNLNVPLAGTKFGLIRSISYSDDSVKESFSLEEPIEETGTLIAMHNQDWTYIYRTFKDLGALPSPSIAIVRADQGHSGYGDTSIVFPRETIDPEADYRNRVYGSDAWTPTRHNAQVEYEINDDAADRIEREIWDLSQKVAGGEFASSSALRGHGIGQDNSTSLSREEIANKIADDEAVRSAYLAEKGENVEPVYKQRKYHDLADNTVLQEYADQVGPTRLAQIAEGLNGDIQTHNRIIEEEADTIKEKLTEAWVESRRERLDKLPEKARNLRIQMFQERKLTTWEMDLFLRGVIQMQEDIISGNTSDIVDRLATAEKIHEKAPIKEVKAWINGKLDDLLGKAGVYNGKDPYTPSGKRRGFAELHWPYTAENIVRAMNNASAKGQGMFGGADARTLLAVASENFQNVDQMHRKEYRLRNENSETYNARLAELDRFIDDFITELVGGADFSVREAAEEALVEAARSGNLTTRGIQKAFKEYDFDISRDQINEVKDLFRTASDFPTEYFEAKPQRVVGFDEAVGIVAPDYAPQEQVEELRNAGVQVIQYETDERGNINDESRLEAVNSLGEGRFSIDEEETDDQGRELSREQADFFANSTARDENGNLQTLYHGTRKGGFTVFKDWAYLTADRNYAERYADRDSGETVYEVYANIEKPFDTRIPEVRELWENEFFGNYSRTQLQETGLPDWTDGYDLAEWIEDEGLDFDAIVLDEGAEPDGNGGTRERGISYVVRNSDQIKNVDNRTPTNNPDIRFALDDAPDSETRTGELEQEIEAGDPAEDNAEEPTIDEKINAAAAYIELDDWAQKAYDDALAKGDTKTADLIQKQRAASRMAKDLRRQANREKAAFKKDGDEAHVQHMNELRRQANEYAKREREYAKQTNVKTAPSPVQTIRRTADSLLKMWHVAPAQQYSYRQQLQGVLEGIYRKGYVGDSDVSALFRSMFDDAVDTVNPDPAYEQVAEMMRDRHIYVSDQVRAEFGDDWESFRRAMWGARMIASSNTADRELDSYYQELAAQNPGIFDPEVADGAVQLQAIYDAVKQGRPKEVPLREAYQMQGLDDEAVFENMYTTAEGILQQFANTADLESRLTRDAEETETNLRGQLREERAAHKERLEQARAAFAEQQRRQRQRREQADLMRRIRNDLRMLERRATHHDEAYARAMSAQDEETQRVMNTVLENVSTVANSITGKKLNNLLELQAAYQSMADTNPNFISDPKIEQLLARIGQVHLTDFSVEDLEAIVEAIQRISHQIKIENDMLDEMWQESLSEAGDAMREETRQAKGRKNSRFFSWVEDSLSLSRGLKRLGGWNPNSQMWRLAEAFERGDMDAMAYQEGADMVLQPFLARRNNDARRKWLYTAAGKNAEFAEVEVPRILGWDQGDAPISDEKGPATIKLQMTQMQLVELALAMKNPDNMRHIKYGGLTVPDANLYKDGHLQDAIEAGQTVKLGPDVVRRIVSENLKPEGKEFAELLDKYYNSWAKTKINGISQKLEGVDRAINRNYYPIKTDKGYLETTYNIFDGTIAGMGPLKARIHSATAPIILGDADSTYKWHRDMMARYVGYAIPMRNFRELMNYAPGFGMQKNNAVIASVYKHGATEFLNDFAKVVETGDLEESKGLNKIVGNYINQVLSANISSMLKQFAALALAGSSYGQGSILRGITNLKAQTKTDPAIIRIYTPYLDMRNQELLYDQVTEIVRDKAGSVGQIALATALGRNWMNATDYWANRMMWAAAEDVVRRQNPNLRPGTEAEIKAGKDLYYKEVARVFNRITFDTQTNSNMMSKPNILRRKDSGIKAWTMFRTDAYQMAGIFREALGQAQWAEAHGTDTEKSAAKRKMINAIASTLTSSMTSAAMGIMANILRRRDKDLRDEEGNVDWKKIGTEFAVESFENLTSCVLAGSEIFSFLAAQFVEGAEWYDITSAPLDAVNDLLNTVQTQSKKIFQALHVFAESDAQYRAANADDLLAPVWKLGKAAAQFFGLPAANIEKNILAVLGWIWPEAAVAVQDAYTEYAKKDLEGKTGAELRATLQAYLSDEVGELSDAAIDEYMRLYELLGSSVLPNANTPGEITTEDEEGNTVKQEVSNRDAGIWDNTYRETMIELINSMVDSDAYKALTDDEKKKMLAKIRSYASEAGKRAIGSDVKDWVEHVHAAADEGVQIADALLYYALSAGGKAADKMQILRDMDMTDAQKRIILDVFESNMSGKIVAAIDGGASADAAIGYYIGQSTAEGVKNGNGATIAGSRQLAQFDALEAMDIPDEEKAAIYHAMYQSTAAAWADAADTMTDMEFLEYAREHFAESRQNIEGKTIPQDTPDTAQPEEKQTNPEYEAAVGAGLSETGAQAAVQAVSALSADASTYQKREAAVLALDDLSDQLAAVQYYSDKPEADYARFSAANGYGVTPKDYYTFYRDATAQYGKLSQKEAKAALDGMDLTQEQKAAMWQLCGANWKAANNPYAVYVSEQVRDAYYSVDTVSRSMPGMTDERADEYAGGNRPTSREKTDADRYGLTYRRGIQTMEEAWNDVVNSESYQNFVNSNNGQMPGTQYYNGSEGWVSALLSALMSKPDNTEQQELVSLDGTTNLSANAKDDYDALKEEGMHFDSALRVVRGLEEREKWIGEMDASLKQRQAIYILDNIPNTVNAAAEHKHLIDSEFAAIKHYSDNPDADYARFKAALGYGVNPGLFMDITEDMLDLYGFDVSQKQAKEYMDEYVPFWYTQKQKAAIWQLINPDWSASANPYAVYVGEQIKDAYDANR